MPMNLSGALDVEQPMWTRRRLLLVAAAAASPGWARAAGDPSPARWLKRDLKMASSRRLVADAERALVRAPTAAAAVHAARCAYWAGLVLQRGGAGVDERRRMFSRGIEHAARARALDDKDPGGHYYDAVHRAKRGELKGVTSSVWELPELVERMGFVYEADRTYAFGGPDRFWGTIIANTPSLILSMQGSSLQKGEAHFRDSAKIAPAYCGTYFQWAKLRARTKGAAGERAMLRRCVAVPPSSDPALEAWNRLYRDRARAALKAKG